MDGRWIALQLGPFVLGRIVTEKQALGLVGRILAAIDIDLALDRGADHLVGTFRDWCADAPLPFRPNVRRKCPCGSDERRNRQHCDGCRAGRPMVYHDIPLVFTAPHFTPLQIPAERMPGRLNFAAASVTWAGQNR